MIKLTFNQFRRIWNLSSDHFEPCVNNVLDKTVNNMKLMPCLSFKSIVQGFAWACAHQLRNEFHWDLYCTDQVLHLDYANEFFAQSQIEPNEKFKYARPTSLRQVSLAFITLPRQLINLVSSPVSYANLPDFQRQAILDAFVVQADAEWNGPGHVQQGLTEDGLPALMKVIAVDILRTHQTLATMRRCRSDGGGIAGRRPATLRTCVLHRVLQQTKEKKNAAQNQHIIIGSVTKASDVLWIPTASAQRRRQPISRRLWFRIVKRVTRTASLDLQ